MKQLNLSEYILTIPTDSDPISGILHSPENRGKAQEHFIVFLHGWAGYRIGPHRMFVQLARQLSSQGYHCFRFDFTGRGYGRGKASETDFNTMQEDFERVLSHIHRHFKPVTVSCIGICSGAKVAIQSLFHTQNPINHLIALSSPPLWYDAQSRTEVKHFSTHIRTYVQKLFLNETWKKLFSGRINCRLIGQIVINPIHRWIKNSYTLLKKPSPSKEQKQGETVSQVNSLGGRLLMIYGDKGIFTN